jgi:cold shock CspA family protein/ribosome-associated translation inhibitor RaiA
MQRPVEITSSDFSLTEPVQADIRRKAAKLDTYYDNILGCKVVVEAPVHHHHKGGPFKVRIELVVPGNDLIVNHKGDEELLVAIREAFRAMRRQLEDYVRQRRGFVKTHEEIPQARVAKLEPDLGYGFLETTDGREVYFHRNSVLHNDFERLAIGMQVRFAEEQGQEGPQASTVTVVGKHHG